MAHTLLLADDSVTIQRVIELTFANEDIRVVAVGDGDQAIAQLEAAPPDIVLADIGMPGKTGYEVAEYMKHSPRLDRIPVLLLTGAFEPVDLMKATAVGCDGVLTKPFEPELVISRVKELLATGRRPPVQLDTEPAPRVEETPDDRRTEEADPPPARRTEDFSDSTLEAYFDQLDATFATLSSGPMPHAVTPAAEVPEDIDWSASRTALPPSDPSLSYGSPKTDFQKAAVPAAPVHMPPGTNGSLPGASFAAPATTIPLVSAEMPLPSLADAFSALLAAEQQTPNAATAPAWPAALAVPIATDDLVEQVARRVLERLSDRVVRETVAQMVATVAERLIRDEIERIKATIE